jgi:beta-N-acetylhexosaminidase
VSIDPDVRRLALSCLLLGYEGDQVPAYVDEALAAGLGGLVLFGSNVGDGTRVRDLTDRLRRAAGRDIVLAIDEEGGDVTRLDTVRGSASPGAAALGHLDDEDATEQVYAAIGARMVDAGLTVNLAPVADVNSDPQNPVIGVRSFGAEPRRAARHVAAAVRGLQSAGSAACVKHFPGHGATSSDSHHELATIARDRAALDAVDLPPFAAAIDAGARSVMTGHLLVPALDPDRLSTVSPAITTELLRERLGFRGTVMTDALEMAAVARTIGIVEGFVQALIAGADAIETGAQDHPGVVDEIPAAVQRALDDGRLTMARLRAAAARTADLARPPEVVRASVRRDATTHGRLGKGAGAGEADIAARCLEIVGPLPELHRPLVVEARPPGGMASGDLPWSVAAPLAALLPDTEVVAVHSDPDATVLTRAAAGRDLVVVVRDPDRHAWQQPLLRLPAAVIVDVGWPSRLPDGIPVIRTRGVAPGLLTAVADALAAPVTAEATR